MEGYRRNNYADPWAMAPVAFALGAHIASWKKPIVRPLALRKDRHVNDENQTMTDSSGEYLAKGLIGQPALDPVVVEAQPLAVRGRVMSLAKD
jgi:hypothetical protein